MAVIRGPWRWVVMAEVLWRVATRVPAWVTLCAAGRLATTLAGSGRGVMVVEQGCWRLLVASCHGGWFTVESIWRSCSGGWFGGWALGAELQPRAELEARAARAGWAVAVPRGGVIRQDSWVASCSVKGDEGSMTRSSSKQLKITDFKVAVGG